MDMIFVWLSLEINGWNRMFTFGLSQQLQQLLASKNLEYWHLKVNWYGLKKIKQNSSGLVHVMIYNSKVADA